MDVGNRGGSHHQLLLEQIDSAERAARQIAVLVSPNDPHSNANRGIHTEDIFRAVKAFSF